MADHKDMSFGDETFPSPTGLGAVQWACMAQAKSYAVNEDIGLSLFWWWI
jgi:hypothetical protein